MELETQVDALLSQAQLSREKLVIKRCAMGGNNRTYRVETPDGAFAVKQYFSHNTDTRDRMGAEFAFLSYAEKVAKGLIPKPYAQDVHHKMALYEFIEGRPFAPDEIAEAEVNAAIEFFCLLNKLENRIQSHQLKNASEACFSIQEHIDLIGGRIKQIQQINPDSEETRLAQHYAEKLNVCWSDWVNKTAEIARKEGFDLATPLETHQRCISPSDFGFHNALKLSDNRICFLDFEYSGWDDPAKMVGDFFAQIAVPVPEKFFEQFICNTMVLFPGSENLVRRAKILRPAYQMKWCCIALNVFLPHHLARRKFADENLNVIALQRAQLTKFERLMQSLKSLEDKYGM